MGSTSKASYGILESGNNNNDDDDNDGRFIECLPFGKHKELYSEQCNTKPEKNVNVSLAFFLSLSLSCSLSHAHNTTQHTHTYTPPHTHTHLHARTARTFALKSYGLIPAS